MAPVRTLTEQQPPQLPQQQPHLRAHAYLLLCDRYWFGFISQERLVEYVHKQELCTAWVR